MGEINYSFLMDDHLKKKMEMICLEMGISIEIAFNLFVKSVVEQHKIPFEITNEDLY